jgi:hypothetical protein
MKNLARLVILFVFIIANLTGTLLYRPVDTATASTSQAGEIRFRQASINVAENAGTVDIVIERINGSDGEAMVGADTFDGTATAGQDYQATGETITFGDGETQKTVSIPIFDNNTSEPDETFQVTLNLLSGSATIIEPSTTTITILDDDTTPPGILHFSSDSYAGLEDTGAITLTVQRSGGEADEVQVSYVSIDGSAASGFDFMSAVGTLTFPDGETEQTLAISLLDDPGLEGHETLTVRLQDVVGVATLGEPFTTTVIILDDELFTNIVYLPSIQR